MKSYRVLTVCAPLLLGVFLIGCNSEPPSGTVNGTIKLDGKDVPNGSVIYHGKDRSGTGTIKDGKYTVAAPLGACKITVVVVKVDDKLVKGKDGETPPAALTIPAKYEEKDKTDLTFEVKSGTQENNIEMKK